MNEIAIPQISEPEQWKDKILAPEKAFEWFATHKAGWWYDGEPDSTKAHAELTSGNCSNGYFDCRKLFSLNPRICGVFAYQLVRILKGLGLVGKFDWIVGSSYSGITLSYRVAEILNVCCAFTETEKDPGEPKKKKQVWKGVIPANSRILQVEDLITTLKTSEQVRKAVLESNAHPVEFLPHVATAVHRPAELPIDYGDDWKIVPLLAKKVWSDEPANCPYCAAGSQRFKPKENWARLTGQA